MPSVWFAFFVFTPTLYQNAEKSKGLLKNNADFFIFLRYAAVLRLLSARKRRGKRNSRPPRGGKIRRRRDAARKARGRCGASPKRRLSGAICICRHRAGRNRRTPCAVRSGGPRSGCGGSFRRESRPKTRSRCKTISGIARTRSAPSSDTPRTARNRRAKRRGRLLPPRAGRSRRIV